MFRTFTTYTLTIVVLTILLTGCRSEIDSPSLTPAVTNLSNPSPTPMPVQVEEIPFETISNWEDANYQDTSTDLIIASQPDEIQSLGEIIWGRPEEDLNHLDLKQFIAVAAFQGWKTTNKYGVEIQRVSKSGANGVKIDAHFTTPEPDLEVNPIVTSPYHLIRIPRDELGGEVTFVLYVDGEELLRETYAISPPPNEVIFPNIHSSAGATATP